MRVEPSLEAVEARYRAGQPTVVWTRLVADLETPVSAMLKLCDGKPNSFLLESVEGGAVRGRYSLIGLQPDLIWRCFGNKAEINRQARFDATRFEPAAGGGMASLRALTEKSRSKRRKGCPQMAAGLFGYLGYDMVRLMEKLPDAQPDKLGLP